MSRRLPLMLSLILFACLGCLQAEAREPDGKKLQVFILAGQSNMTGYCGIQTLTNVANSQSGLWLFHMGNVSLA